MKLTNRQLQGIIKEEVRKALRGRIDETAGLFPGGGKTQEALDEINDEWIRSGEGDPSLASTAADLGVEPMALWSEQVEAAIEDLTNRWTEAYDAVDSKLVDGGYLPRRYASKW